MIDDCFDIVGVNDVFEDDEISLAGAQAENLDQHKLLAVQTELEGSGSEAGKAQRDREDLSNTMMKE